jgi:hypothetical protein
MAVYDVNGSNISGGGSSPFYDVQAYGATGDGTADDTTAIQNALTDCHNAGGGTVFFPTGTYKITSQLICYSDQNIDLNGSTILQGGEISNLLMGYCTSDVTEYNGCHDIVIQNGTFDGGNYTLNNTLVGFIHSKNLTFKNCAFVNAYGAWHNVEICACYNVLFDNCIFEGARKTSENGEMIQIDGHNGSGTWPWANTGTIDNTPCKYIEVRNCLFYDGLVAPAIGNHSTYSSADYSDSRIRIHDCVFKDITGTKSAVSMQDGHDIDIYNCTFDTCTQGVRQCQYSDAPTTVHDCRFIDTTTPYPSYASAYVKAYNNMIDGTFTE